MTRYPDHLTASIAHEHINDLLRAAHAARLASDLPDVHKVPRLRPAWWTRVTRSQLRRIPLSA